MLVCTSHPPAVKLTMAAYVEAAAQKKCKQQALEEASAEPIQPGLYSRP